MFTIAVEVGLNVINVMERVNRSNNKLWFIILGEYKCENGFK